MKVDRDRKENNVSTYMEKLFKSEEKKSHHNKQENIKEHKRLYSITNAINSIKGVESSYHIIIFYNT